MKEKLKPICLLLFVVGLGACGSEGSRVEVVGETTTTRLEVAANGVEPRSTTTTTAPPVEVKAKVVEAPSADHEDVPTVTIEPPEIAYGGDVQAIICEVFGPHCAKAIAVATCESSLDPTAGPSRTNDYGLFQLNGNDAQRWIDVLWWDAQLSLGLGRDAIFNPYVNSYLAYSQSRGGTDWSTWTCG